MNKSGKAFNMKYYFVSYNIRKNGDLGQGRAFVKTSLRFLHILSIEEDLNKDTDGNCVITHYHEVTEEEYTFQHQNLCY